MKTLVQFFIIVIFFFATWHLLSKVDWIRIFNIEEISNKTEERLGDLLWDFIKQTEKEIKHKEVKDGLDLLLKHLCEKNNIRKENIKLFIVDKNEINAFALPNRIMVIYSGLIKNCENEEELLGVIGHELAHMEHNHVMKKLIKEMGLNVLIGMTTPNANVGTIGEVAKALSSTAFDRSLESEADLTALDYLLNANINPEPFADFLYKMSLDQPGFVKKLSWISTHPEPEERAKSIVEKLPKATGQYHRVLTEDAWKEMKKILSQ